MGGPEVAARFESAHRDVQRWSTRIALEVSAYRVRIPTIHLRFLLIVDNCQQDLTTVTDCLRHMIRLTGGALRVLDLPTEGTGPPSSSERGILRVMRDASRSVGELVDRLPADEDAADPVRDEYHTVRGMMELAATQLALACEDAALVLR